MNVTKWLGNILTRTRRSLMFRIGGDEFSPTVNAALLMQLESIRPDIDWDHITDTSKHLFLELHSFWKHKPCRRLVWVGANRGSLALEMDLLFPGIQFVLLEPVPETFAALSINIRDRPNMMAIQCAVGESNESGVINVDHFDAASSLLDYDEVTMKEFQHLGTINTHSVPIRRLDDLLREIECEQVDWLVVDVQGYEDHVLRGASAMLAKCSVVLIELSLIPLYESSSTFGSIYEFLHQLGFTLRFLVNPLMGQSHRILQIDGGFVRNDL